MSPPEPESARAAKNAIRAEVGAVLRLMSADERAESTERAWARLEQTEIWRKAGRVMVYSPMAIEPDLDRLWSSGAEGLGLRELCYPRVVGRDLEVRTVTARSQLRPAAFGLLEPDPDRTTLVDAATIDLVIVPGLAFTRDGDRLGRGGGYYDRFLAGLPSSVVTVALAFACQMRDHLPMEAHDQRVHSLFAG